MGAPPEERSESETSFNREVEYPESQFGLTKLSGNTSTKIQKPEDLGGKIPKL